MLDAAVEFGSISIDVVYSFCPLYKETLPLSKCFVPLEFLLNPRSRVEYDAFEFALLY